MIGVYHCCTARNPSIYDFHRLREPFFSRRFKAAPILGTGESQWRLTRRPTKWMGSAPSGTSSESGYDSTGGFPWSYHELWMVREHLNLNSSKLDDVGYPPSGNFQIVTFQGVAGLVLAASTRCTVHLGGRWVSLNRTVKNLIAPMQMWLQKFAITII